MWWPSYILMPAFSIFTYSCEKIDKKWYLVFSQKWTKVNWIIILLQTIIPFSIYYLPTKADIFLGFCGFCVPALLVIFLLHMIVTKCCRLFISKSGLDIETFEVMDVAEVICLKSCNCLKPTPSIIFCTPM